LTVFILKQIVAIPKKSVSILNWKRNAGRSKR
jgi:hypothetical protein